MSDAIIERVLACRNELFPDGLRRDWVKVQGPVIELTLPFAAATAVVELLATDHQLKAYQVRVNTRVATLPRVARRTGAPKNVIAVASGKGGVGKSAVTTNLALGLQQQGARVGILDADIYGPSIPLMLGCESEQPAFDEQRRMTPVQRLGLEANSMGFLVEADDAAVWRGPMASKAFSQLFFDTRWSQLDYLLIDMPPGTGDVQLTLAQQLPVTAAVIVTTPQNIALADARKGVAMFRKTDVPVVGLLENMSYFMCGQCDHREYVFGQGGGMKLARALSVPLLGEWPLASRLGTSLAEGQPLAWAQPTDPISQQIYQSAAALAVESWQLMAPEA